MAAIIPRDEALALIAAWLDDQVALRRQGERWIAVNLNSAGEITSVKAAEAPPRFKRLQPGQR